MNVLLIENSRMLLYLLYDMVFTKYSIHFNFNFFHVFLTPGEEVYKDVVGEDVV